MDSLTQCLQLLCLAECVSKCGWESRDAHSLPKPANHLLGCSDTEDVKCNVQKKRACRILYTFPYSVMYSIIYSFICAFYILTYVFTCTPLCTCTHLFTLLCSLLFTRLFRHVITHCLTYSGAPYSLLFTYRIFLL